MENQRVPRRQNHTRGRRNSERTDAESDVKSVLSRTSHRGLGLIFRDCTDREKWGERERNTNVSSTSALGREILKYLM